MQTISVVVAAPSDLQAQGIAAAVLRRSDMTLVGQQVTPLSEIGAALDWIPRSQVCALVLVGSQDAIREQESRWLAERPRLVVLGVELGDDVVRIAIRDPSLEMLLNSLLDLVQRAGRNPTERVTHVRLGAPPGEGATPSTPDPAVLSERPLLTAAVVWLRATFQRAGLTLAGDAGTSKLAPTPVPDPVSAATLNAEQAGAAARADEALTQALGNAALAGDPLALLAHRLQLTALEFRAVLLAIAPEIDVLFQHCFAQLHGDGSRRAPTLTLCAALLGDPVTVRRDLAHSGNLSRWRLLDGRIGAQLPSADEPLRLDPVVVAWLLGAHGALEQDLRLSRILRQAPWPGAMLVDDGEELRQAVRHLRELSELSGQRETPWRWLLFNGDHLPMWRALLERAGELIGTPPLRVQPSLLTNVDIAEQDDTTRRLTRLSRLTGCAVVLDLASIDASPELDDTLRRWLSDFAASSLCAGVLCTNLSRCIGLLGTTSVRIVSDRHLSDLNRHRTLAAAAARLDLRLSPDLLEGLEQQFPLHADGWERALQLTLAHGSDGDAKDRLTARFLAACRDVAAESVSALAVRMDPHCTLADVVLPPDRKHQLHQIADGVRFARHVLEDWKFGEQLAYGRSVTALLHGPSGTGKTMSALAVARELNRQVLRIDLSRVMSKYIGDTPKHVDAVFRDATQCGAVLLIDEADALLGKRSEVRDSHDRYANIEVSYLLQRLEVYEGVAIFTTNARQNLDPAFLRRLRFIIEFPRPDADAREQIWKRCLPKDSHALDDTAFRQLARKMDLTGGHIRQITLQAAFLAAPSRTKISLAHIAQASAAELAKLGLPPVVLEGYPSTRAA